MQTPMREAFFVATACTPLAKPQRSNKHRIAGQADKLRSNF